jgi:FeS assembly protein IscX
LTEGTNGGSMDWDDAEEIGAALYAAFPDLDPLSIRFTELHKMVMDLDGFEGDAKRSNEARLEAIQMAWLEEYEDHQ